MINILLFIGILFFFAYALYDQFGMDFWKGKSLLKLNLKKQAKKDGVIFIVLLIVIIYQTQASITAVSLYLLATLIILTIYAAFIRSPVLILKQQGFFFGNVYFSYKNIYQINLAEGNILVIDMQSGKRLLVHLLTEKDREQVVEFFGGYKN
ncbi:DUF986 family protein [Pasteurella canis]|uniref:UPF0266 membrane protein NCTC11621_00558 n=1 Tax=Pasteurella canis TaxID=753 RepID=A0A379ET03_9PAST|nr:DUF986 family protein [Pasteurella canis]UAY78592.1 DUF986 family protein [Pasteurella canis]UEA17831.1 DUF986 family protein [Pasteurella canis]SUC09486.1 membrane protein [Pasteurella canis]